MTDLAVHAGTGGADNDERTRAGTRCIDRSARGWSEFCTLWNDGRRFAVAVDTSDHPYPLQTMRGSWSVDGLAGERSRLAMTFVLQPRSGLGGRLFVWALHAAFPLVLRRILRGWNGGRT